MASSAESSVMGSPCKTDCLGFFSAAAATGRSASDRKVVKESVIDRNECNDTRNRGVATRAEGTEGHYCTGMMPSLNPRAGEKLLGLPVFPEGEEAAQTRPERADSVHHRKGRFPQRRFIFGPVNRLQHQVIVPRGQVLHLDQQAKRNNCVPLFDVLLQRNRAGEKHL